MENIRLTLAADRIREIAAQGAETDAAYKEYFQKTAQQICLFLDEYERLYPEGWEETLPDITGYEIEALQDRNRALYSDILSEHYAESFANPQYCVQLFGDSCGKLMAALVYEIRSMIPLLYENAVEQALIRMELFLEFYSAFSVELRLSEDAAEQPVSSIPKYESLLAIYADYISDYAEEEASYEIGKKLTCGSGDYMLQVLNAIGETGDLRYLYAYGEYISASELEAARYLAQLPDETLEKMAFTWSEGYRIGFITTGKDLSKKKRVGIIGRIGFDRLMAQAARNFEALGKEVILFREIETVSRLLGSGFSGCRGAEANPQYRYDHREDLALVLDDAMLTRKTEALEAAYKSWNDETVLFGGPAVLETFGEKPFTPVSGDWQAKFDRAQQKLIARFRTKSSRLYNEAVIGENRSFTIISFPVPDIADRGQGVDPELYRKIFDATILINTLDYQKYQRIQSTLIDALDQADYVHVRGRGDNRTDLKVNLWKLQDPSKETIFENCVADLNIPVGEVFTTPVLTGTNGVLHTTQVYLEGLLFKDLELTFRDGRVADYHCGNFGSDEDEKGRAYIEENILFHHDTLPMGECAIGTNTTAYEISRQFGIGDRLPILIAEKTGPHFAVGDTCYSDDEDNISYNPDGKRIVARENDYSLLRHEDPTKAYFGCHTDITIPYDELGSYEAVRADGSVIEIIRDGRFVLPGTEELNEAFETKYL